MMTCMFASPMARRGVRLHAVASAALVILGLTACADKGLTRSPGVFNPKIALQLTTIASAQTALSPKYVWVGAAYGADKDTALLAYRFVPYAAGTQQITLPVDLAPCLAFNASHGKDGCTILVGASLLPDTFALKSDSTQGGGDPFRSAFDYTIVGPFEVGPGRTPTIPAIDLSASRFGVVTWEGDEALRLGGTATPSFLANFSTSGLGGVFAGTSDPVLFALTGGVDYSTLTANTQPQPHPQLAILQGGVWKRVSATTAPSNSNFADVTALAASEAYIASPNGLYRFDGTSIARVSTVPDSLLAVSNVNNQIAKRVIAGGPNGVVWIGDTQTWNRWVLPGAPRIDGVCITGPNEAYAASSQNGGLFRFDGTSWTTVTALNGGNKYDLSCPAPGQAFVLSAGQLMKSTATGWTTMTSSGLPNGRPIRYAVVSANEMYAYSDSANVNRAFYRYDGSGTWRSAGQLRFTQPAGRLLADPRGGAAYLASGASRIEKISATANPSVLSYQPQLRDVVVTSPTSAFAVGWNLFLARWDGVQWNIDAPPANTPTIRILQGVWSDGPKNAWAVGNSSTILHYDGTGWSVLSDVNRPIAAADGYNAVWGTTGEVWIAGATTMLHCTAVTACVNEPTGGTGTLYGIWGTSRTSIIAVGAGGRIARYNGTTWSAMSSPTTRTLARVAGSGPSDVWAVGDSVLLHFDGTQWTNYPLTSDQQNLVSHVPSPYLQALFQVGLWVRGPKEVYLGNDFGAISRWDGQRWNEVDRPSFRRRVIGISGAGGCVLAVTDGQSDLPSPTLWRGLGPSGCFSAPFASPSIWP